MDAVWVEWAQFGGDTEAGDGGSGRPRVAGHLGGEVAGEILAVGGVPGDSDVEVFDVQEPHLLVLTQPDGDQERVGGRLVVDLGTDLLEGDGGADLPVQAVWGAFPGVRKVTGFGQVQDQVGLGELDRSDHRHGRAVGGGRGGESAQHLVHVVDGGGSDRPHHGDRLLDRAQDRLGAGQCASWAPVAKLSTSAPAQQHEHGPGQQCPSPTEAGEHPRRSRHVLAGVRRGVAGCCALGGAGGNRGHWIRFDGLGTRVGAGGRGRGRWRGG